MRAPVRKLTLLLLTAAGPAILGACGDSPVRLAKGDRMRLELTGLRPLDPQTDGSLEVWVRGAGATFASAGRLSLAGDAPSATTLALPIDSPDSVVITVEPPGDADAEMSRYRLLGGVFDANGRATLSIEGQVTDGRRLHDQPGAHSLFTTSNNLRLGYPSFENAGLWLFSLTPELNEHKRREVKLTPLRATWLYEGWIVYRPGTASECWVPYGKFRPDPRGYLTSRDNTGSGMFSGDEDYLNAGVEDVPGDEWTENIFGLPLPCGLQLPLALDSVDVDGTAVWHHRITIEPGFDEFEPAYTDRPFLLRPYDDAIGAGHPGNPRVIEYLGNDPAGRITVSPGS